MKTMTLDEVRKLPPLSRKEIERIQNFKDIDFSDCPPLTDEELSRMKPCHLVKKNYQESEVIAI